MPFGTEVEVVRGDDVESTIWEAVPAWELACIVLSHDPLLEPLTDEILCYLTTLFSLQKLLQRRLMGKIIMNCEYRPVRM